MATGEEIIAVIAMAIAGLDFILRFMQDGKFDIGNVLITIFMLLVYYAVLWVLLKGYRAVFGSKPATS